jgi:N-acetylglucosaminyldiphosphoundecaprenol N-acetyl-beta-D-mannosaminyltransferase
MNGSASHLDRPPASIDLLGVPVHAVTLRQAAERIAHAAAAGVGGWVVTPNLDILRRAVTEPDFRRLYDATSLRLADGAPLVWASKLRGTPLPERAAGSDLIFALAEQAAAAGVSIYLLGGNPGTAEASAARLTTLHPTLRIAGIECPEAGFESRPGEIEAMIERIRAADAGVVLVALGCPKQERLIERLRPSLPRAWFIGIGITFSFVAGEVVRAPRWMQRCGLEWVHRLAQEPGRLAKRYLLHGLPFAVRLLASSTLERFGRPSVEVGS